MNLGFDNKKGLKKFKRVGERGKIIKRILIFNVFN